MMHRGGIGVFLYLFGSWGAAAAEPTAKGPSLEEAEKSIVEQYSRIQSCSANIHTVETAESLDGSEARAEIDRRVEWTRKGRGFLYRAESLFRTTRRNNGVESTEESKATTVSDGVSVVTISEKEGRKAATRRKADIATTPDIGLLLNELRKDQVLSRLPDVKVGFDDCYAIRIIPKDVADSDISQTIIYFRKDIGMDVRTVVYGKNQKPIYTSTTSDIRLNHEIPADRFIIVLPDGVELQDLTGGK